MIWIRSLFGAGLVGIIYLAVYNLGWRDGCEATRKEMDKEAMDE